MLRIENCFLSEGGVRSFGIWATDPLMVVRLSCGRIERGIWKGETCCGERLRAAGAVIGFPQLSLRLNQELKILTFSVVLMSGGSSRQLKVSGSCAWQLQEPWVMVEVGRGEGPWGSMTLVKSLGLPLFHDSSTVIALDFNQGFRNLIEAVQAVQGTVGGGPPQCGAGGCPQQQRRSPFRFSRRRPHPRSEYPSFRGIPRFWMRYLPSLNASKVNMFPFGHI